MFLAVFQTNTPQRFGGLFLISDAVEILRQHDVFKRPEIGCSRPPRILMSVVLPEPDGPIIAIHSPDSTSKLTWPRARTASNRFSRSSTWTKGAIILPAIFPPGARVRAAAAEAHPSVPRLRPRRWLPERRATAVKWQRRRRALRSIAQARCRSQIRSCRPPLLARQPRPETGA